MNRSHGSFQGVLQLAAPAAIAMGIWSPAVMGQCVANELTKLTAFDAEAGDYFGRTVAISGDIAVIGAMRDDTEQGGWESGTARVYRLDGTQWIEEAALISSDIDEQDWFGFSVAVSGDAILVGASAADGFETSASGAAYVFRFNGSEWVQEDKLTASDAAGSDYFGSSVSIHGDVAVVGAPGVRIATTGKAYVYRFNGAEWIEEAKLLAFDANQQDRFGNSVAISGDVAVIGAYNEGNTGNPWGGTGAAYVYRFDQQTGQWNGEGKLISPDPLPGQLDQFGRSVSIRDDAQVMVIGTEPLSFAPPVPVGSAYVFRFDPDACRGPECSPWIDEAKLVASDGDGGDRFGYAVSISGDVVVIGAWGVFEDNCPFPLICNAGAAYVFRFDETHWNEEAKITSTDIQDGDLLGWSVSLNGDTAVIGAFRDGDAGLDSGSAYIFGGLSDCNDNGVLDLCDIADGTSKDANGNGIPDECEFSADLTGPLGVPDGCVDAFDLGAMLGAWCSAVNDPNPPSPPCENCTPANLAVADISGAANVPDGCVDAFDLAKLLAEWCSVAGGNPCGTCQ